MSEVLVKVDNLSKKFCRDLKRSLFYGVKDMTKEIFSPMHSANETLRKDEFWAVDDVSFELKRGDCLGLIGRNGAGKSTLLKMLNGLIKPDKGRIEMQGRVAALIELGSGFNPILTGRENISIYGTVLGLTKKEIDDRYDQIFQFSELEDFIETPLQYYSSGMKVRLGFSVAAHMDPDVLILDEVLAVGDAGFKIKSINKMREMISNAAVIFVNHSMNAISRNCNRIMLLSHGKSLYSGDNVAKGIELYFDQYEGDQPNVEYNEFAQIHKFKIRSKQNTGNDSDGMPIITYYDDMLIDLEVTVDRTIKKFELIFSFFDKDTHIVASYHSYMHGKSIINSNKRISLVFNLPRVMFSSGNYTVSAKIINMPKDSSNIQTLALYRNFAAFKMKSFNVFFRAPFLLYGDLISEP